MNIFRKKATFQASSDYTNILDMDDNALTGVIIPASMVGTTLTFEVGTENSVSSMVPLRDDLGNNITVSISNTAGFYSLRRILPINFCNIRVKSNAAANGDAGKEIQLVGQKLT